jgi:hypothetical protein
LQFDLDYYESEVLNHDNAEVQEEEEVWRNEKFPEAKVPQSPAPDTRARNLMIKRKPAIITFGFKSQERCLMDTQHAFET